VTSAANPLSGRRVRAISAILSAIAVLLLVAAAPALADSTWGGGGSDSNWSTATNWQNGTGPAASTADGTLTFPSMSCSSTCASTNDLGGVSLTGLTIDAKTSYNVTGNAITLGSGGISTTGSGSNLAASWSAPIALSSSQTWSIGGGGQLAMNGTISGASDAVTADLSSYSILALNSDDEIGPVTTSGTGFLSLGGGASLNGTDGNAVGLTSGSFLQEIGNATVGPLTVSGSNVGVGSAFSVDNLTVNGTASIDGASATTFGLSASAGSQLSASGNVSLGGSVSFETCSALTPGTTYTLVQSTGGTLSGTFSNAPEGATLTAQCFGSTPEGTVQLHYTATSVTASVITPTTTTLASPNPTSSVSGQSVTLTATVAAGSGSATPTGTVAFDSGAQPITGCTAQPLDTSGSATCTTSFPAAASPESLTAVYTPGSGSGFEGSSTGSPTSLTVGQDATTTAVSASTTTAYTGQSVTYTASVTPAAPGAGAPSGPVAFSDNATAIASCSAQPLGAGAPSSTATCTVPYTATGTHAVTATYGGDGSFTGSSASGGPTVTVLAPPALAFTQSWGSYGAGAGQFTDTYGAATYGGDVYVIDSGNNRVEEFTDSGTYVRSFGSAGSGNGQFTQAQGIAADPQTGTIYVADDGNGRVVAFTASGQYVTTFGSGTLRYPTQIAVDGSGNVYVADYGISAVAEFNSSGTYLRSFGGGYGAGAGQLSEPWGVVVNGSGDVYVSDYSGDRISEFDSTGAFVLAWGWGVSDGAAQFETCTLTCQAGIAGSGDGQLNYPANIALDSAGNVWVVEQQDARIDEFTPSGGFVQAAGWGVSDGQSSFETCSAGCQAGLSGTGAGQLMPGYGLTIDSAGDIYVADGDDRIDEFALAAPATTAAPAITGTAQDGATLTAAPGTWSPAAGSYAYAWYDCTAASAGATGSGCSQISGASSSTYTLAPGDVGDSVEVAVTATNGIGSSSAVASPVTAQVLAIKPANAGGSTAPSISGTAQEGQTLTASTGTWTGSTPITYSYQWVSCDGSGANCSPISGATGSNYTLSSSDVGHELKATVTASNSSLAGGASTPADAPLSEAVATNASPTVPTPPAAPTIQSAPASPSGSAAAAFSFAGVSGARFACSLDGATPAPCTSPAHLSGLGDGRHTFAVTQTVGGLGSTPATYSWTVDATPPGAPTIVGGPDPETGSATATLQFETDPGATAECSLDHAAFAACTSPVTRTGLSLGQHTFAVLQIDAAGVASAPATRAWLIDLNFHSGPAGTNHPSVTGAINPQLAVNGLQPVPVGCRLNRGSLQQCTVDVYADPAHAGIAATQMIGTGRSSYAARGHESAVVEVMLNALGRRLLNEHPAGVRATFTIVAMAFDTSDVSSTSTQSTLHSPELVFVPSAGLFPGGAAQLNAAALSYVTSVAKLIAGATRVRCEGYTDNSLAGPAAYRLGLERARAVCAALTAAGLHARWTAISYGSSRPRASNATPAGRAANRRVDVRVWF